MRKYLYIFIVAIGLLQALGFIFQVKQIRGIGAATGSSPLPLVFTEVKGVETFASDFFIEFIDTNGVKKEIQITPALYSKLQGPYNRRNVYGAAISYGPILDQNIWESILKYGLCKKVLLKEMGLPANGSEYTIRIKTKTKGRSNEWLLKPDCTQ